MFHWQIRYEHHGRWLKLAQGEADSLVDALRCVEDWAELNQDVLMRVQLDGHALMFTQEPDRFVAAAFLEQPA